MKLGLYDYFLDVTTHANPHGAATTLVAWAVYHCLVSFRVFFCFFILPTGHTVGSILTIYMSYDVFSPKDVPFGGLVDIAPRLGGQIPQNGPE